MKYRHECKYEISYGDMLALRNRLSAVMKRDIHSPNRKYLIRSLYFDNIYDKALREKTDGANKREKFRIRYYNNDTSFIRLEKKSKLNGLCLKEGVTLSAEQASSAVCGDLTDTSCSCPPLLSELLAKMKYEGLRPKTVVDYTREAFVYASGNVRVTLDSDIRTGIRCTDFLSCECVTVPCVTAPIILEVKWDEYLPDIIRAAVQLPIGRAGAFSKYAACRIYG